MTRCELESQVEAFAEEASSEVEDELKQLFVWSAETVIEEPEYHWQMAGRSRSLLKAHAEWHL